MALTNAGRDLIASALYTGSISQPFSNTYAAIGVGGGTGASDAFDAGDTDLQGTSKLRKGMEASYPSIAANVLTFRSLFGTGDANWEWVEWGVFNDVDAGQGTMLCRKVESPTLGTKTSAQSWQLTVTITVNAA